MKNLIVGLGVALMLATTQMPAKAQGLSYWVVSRSFTAPVTIRPEQIPKGRTPHDTVVLGLMTLDSYELLRTIPGVRAIAAFEDSQWSADAMGNRKVSVWAVTPDLVKMLGASSQPAATCGLKTGHILLRSGALPAAGLATGADVLLRGPLGSPLQLQGKVGVCDLVALQGTPRGGEVVFASLEQVATASAEFGMPNPRVLLAFRAGASEAAEVQVVKDFLDKQAKPAFPSMVFKLRRLVDYPILGS